MSLIYVQYLHIFYVSFRLVSSCNNATEVLEVSSGLFLLVWPSRAFALGRGSIDDPRIPPVPQHFGNNEANKSGKVAAAGEGDETPIISAIKGKD